MLDRVVEAVWAAKVDKRKTYLKKKSSEERRITRRNKRKINVNQIERVYLLLNSISFHYRN